MLVYKFDVMAKLKEKGYTSYTILKQNIIPQSTVQRLRNGEMISLTSLDKICSLLELQPGSIIKWIPDEEVSDEKETADS